RIGGLLQNRRELSSVTGSRGGTARSVVAVARAGDELAPPARRNHFHLDGAERAIAARVRGIVRENVLVANVVCDLLADVVHVVDIFREVCQPARRSGDLLEHFAGALGFLLVLLAEQTNG